MRSVHLSMRFCMSGVVMALSKTLESLSCRKHRLIYQSRVVGDEYNYPSARLGGLGSYGSGGLGA